MRLEPISLLQNELENNFKTWQAKIHKGNEPEPEILNLFNEKLFTTHCFPFEKITPQGDVIPYESIFSSKDHNGVLSNGYRKLLKINPDDDKSSRNIPKGLENYVFTYLGIHQPYYARKNDGKIGLNSKPFGIFVKNPLLSIETEKFPHNHASRRDVGKNNDDVDQKKTDLEFLLPKDARLLMAYQVCNDPDHNCSPSQLERFWHYYGNNGFWNDGEYATNSWKKKAEFRFFERLKLEDIEAVLWPIWLDEIDGVEEKYSRTYDDLKIYSRKLTKIKFITYDLDLRKPEICFVEASYLALAYYFQKGIFPDSAQLAKLILS